MPSRRRPERWPNGAFTVIAVGTWNSGSRRRQATYFATSTACPPPSPMTLAAGGNPPTIDSSSDSSSVWTRCTPASPSPSSDSANRGHRSSSVTTRYGRCTNAGTSATRLRPYTVVNSPLTGRPPSERSCEGPGGVGHDPLLGRLGRSELGHDPALAHDQDPIAHAEHLGQLGRDHDDPDSGRGKPTQQRVDLALCPDVDAACGLIDEQDPAAGVQPLGEDDLLLVAARQVADGRAGAPCTDREPRDVLHHGAPLAARVDDPVRGDVVHPRDRDVRRDRLDQQQPVGLAVL